MKASCTCLLYTSDAADDLLCVDLGGRRIIKKKNMHNLLDIHIVPTSQPPMISNHTTATGLTDDLHSL